MTNTETVIWTLCPQGFTDSGRLRVSAFVSPRLTADKKTTSLAQWMGWDSWADTVAAATFDIQVVTGAPGQEVRTSLPANTVKRVSTTDPALYANLFAKTTPVTTYVFRDFSKKMFVSYPVAKLERTVRAMYAQLAASAQDTMPSQEQLLQVFMPNRGDLTNQVYSKAAPPSQATMISRLKDIYRLDKARSFNDLPPDALTELFAFYHQPLTPEISVQEPARQGDMSRNALQVTYKGYKTPDAPNIATQMSAIDFHRLVAAIGNYPRLARMCGLIVDFEIDPGALAGAAVPANFAQAQPVQLALKVTRHGKSDHTVTDLAPVTACTYLPGQSFAARISDDKRYSGGYLKLNSTGLDLIQMDVDGALHKTIGFTTSLLNMRNSAHDDDTADTAPTESGVASLRTGGLMLVHSDRHIAVQEKMQRATALNGVVPDGKGSVPTVGAGDDSYVLVAEDLMRGIRVDIQRVQLTNGKITGKQPWQSLCRRQAIYDIRNAPSVLDPAHDLSVDFQRPGTARQINAGEEEGTISLALGSSPDGSVPNIYKLHEGLFVWRGWSLCAPEPFKSLAAKPQVDPSADVATQHAQMVGETDAVVPNGMPMAAHFTVTPGSLPSLRFGHSYVTRVRTVDLTGYSQPFNSDGPAGVESLPITYLRYEPVETPVLTLVSTPTLLPAQKTAPGDLRVIDNKTASQSVGGQSVGGQPVVADADMPRWGESMGRMALRTYNATPDINTKVNSDRVRRNVAPPRVTQRFAETHGVLDDKLGKTGAPGKEWLSTLSGRDNGFDTAMVAPIDNPAGKATPYMVAPPQFSLPYLPDPLAAGVAVWLKTPGQPWGSPQLFPFYAGTKYDENVALDWPKCQHLRIEGGEDYGFGFEHTGRVITIPLPKGVRQKVRISSVIRTADVDRMALFQMIKDTAPGKANEMKRRIAEGRHWMFTPWREIELVHAVQKPLVTPSADHLVQAPRAKGQLFTELTVITPLDGKSTTRLDLNASWSEPDDNDADADAKSAPAVRPHRQHVVQTVIARADGPNFTLDKVQHHFPDTRYRRVTYTLEAASRFKEFFQQTDTTFFDAAGKPVTTRGGGPLSPAAAQKVVSSNKITWVLNTATPAPPKVLYVMPTFGWLQAPGTATGSRRVGGLRVYLDRPWMTTGYNEMLAVVLPLNTPVPGDSVGNVPSVTQWGRDPIRISGAIDNASPPPNAFDLAKWQGPIAFPGTNFPADEGSLGPEGPFEVHGLPVPGQDAASRYSVAPHQVGYDPDRELWYCDITVNLPGGSYFPFVRLAVARYQPYSRVVKDDSGQNILDSQHLSSVVTCDFMQISPDRIAVIVATDAANNRYKVFVFGDQPQNAGYELPDLPNSAGKKFGPYARLGAVNIQTQTRGETSDPVLGWHDATVDMKTSPDTFFNGQTFTDLGHDDATKLATQLAGSPLVPPPAAPSAGTGGFGLLGGLVIIPKLIYSQGFTAPPAATGVRRRLLITETELFEHEGAGDVTRIVYAEGLEF